MHVATKLKSALITQPAQPFSFPLTLSRTFILDGSRGSLDTMQKSAIRSAGKTHIKSTLKVLVAIATILGCHHTLGQETRNVVTGGNLASQRQTPLTSISEATCSDSPVDFMDLAARKTREGDYAQAAKALIVGSAYGHYDTLRVEDKTAHQGIKVLAIEKMGHVSMEKAKKLQAAILAVGGLNGEGVIEILNDFGRPSYHPTYLIQHGMGALTGQGHEEGGIVQGFNPEAAWSTVLRSVEKQP